VPLKKNSAGLLSWTSRSAGIRGSVTRLRQQSGRLPESDHNHFTRFGCRVEGLALVLKKVRDAAKPNSRHLRLGGWCDSSSFDVAMLTNGYLLPARFSIPHKVGPVWHGGQNNESELLASRYRCLV
jgi:O-acetyl-ADP-ribose deacetylase (regulator of RNase III)